MNVGENIKRARKALKMTQEEFSKKIGISRSYLGDLEKGRRNPSTETVKKIADKIGVSAFYLLTGVPNVNDSTLLQTEPLIFDTEELEKDVRKYAIDSLISRIDGTAPNYFSKAELYGLLDFVRLQDYQKNDENIVGYDLAKATIKCTYSANDLLSSLNELDPADTLNFQEVFHSAHETILNLKDYSQTLLNITGDLENFIWQQYDENKENQNSH